VRARRSCAGGAGAVAGDGGGEAENGGSVNWASAGIEGADQLDGTDDGRVVVFPCRGGSRGPWA
jgi:hypothetical protein